MIKGATIMIHTHQTAPTQFVEANGIRFAYRRFGKAGGVPIVFNLHYLGTMDHWDPAVTDGLAKEREVILFDNAGVSSSSGEVPTSVERISAALPASDEGPRSRSKRQSGAGAARGHRQIGCSARTALRLSESHPTADAGR